MLDEQNCRAMLHGDKLMDANIKQSGHNHIKFMATLQDGKPFVDIEPYPAPENHVYDGVFVHTAPSCFFRN